MLDVDLTFSRPGFSLSANFTLRSGGITVLRGDSGSGKTTLANLLSGAIAPQKGRIVSDDDVENQKRMEMKRAKQMYFCAIVFFAVAVVFALVAYFLKNPWWTIGAFLCIVGYFVCAFFSKPRYKRLAANGIYRAAVFVIMLIVVAVITVFGVVG